MDVLTKRARRAFSLIELMIVIVIMAVLAAIIIPKFQDQSRRSKEAALKSDLSQVRTAIATFQADTGFYPKLLTDLAATSAPTQGYDLTATLQSITAANWTAPTSREPCRAIRYRERRSLTLSRRRAWVTSPAAQPVTTWPAMPSVPTEDHGEGKRFARG